MHNIYYYRDKNGYAPVEAYINELANSSGKDSRIKLTKIRDYVKALSLYGTRVGEPQVKHLAGDIWELRPLRDRILFAAWVDGSFVLLHVFMKKTRKTPQKEIEKAIKELVDWKERSC